MFTRNELFKDLLSSDSPIIVAFSGGKDSIAVVLYLFSLGVNPERIHLHHHEVDGKGPNFFDWPCTSSYCQAFADECKLKLYFSYRNGGILKAIYRNNEPRQNIYYQQVPGGRYHEIVSDQSALNTRLKFPAVSGSLITRWCSAEVKIDVMKSIICHNPDYQGKLFVLTGERREESSKRSQYQEIENHSSNSKKRRVIAWRPIIDWTEHQVWEILREFKIQPHPCYMLGWSRCSCQLCIFSSPDIWAKINRINPDKVDRIAAIEKDIGFTLYSKENIYSFLDKGIPATELNEYWTSQALGEFTALVKCKDWNLPAGAYTKQRAGAI